MYRLSPIGPFTSLPRPLFDASPAGLLGRRLLARDALRPDAFRSAGTHSEGQGRRVFAPGPQPPGATHSPSWGASMARTARTHPLPVASILASSWPCVSDGSPKGRDTPFAWLGAKPDVAALKGRRLRLLSHRTAQTHGPSSPRNDCSAPAMQALPGAS